MPAGGLQTGAMPRLTHGIIPRTSRGSPTMDVAAPQALEQQTVRLEFTARGTGYFGIWIVNLLLSVLTLGVYSAWAKVRRLQYFYRNTSLAGVAFAYHGQPLAILRGLVIAVVLLVAYRAALHFGESLGFTFASTAEMKRWAEGKSKAYIYTRYGNPTLAVTERKIAALEGAEEAVVAA